MNTPLRVIENLDHVSGGQQAGKNQEGQVQVQLPNGISGSVGGKNARTFSSKRNECLDIVGSQAAWYDTGDTVARRQKELCAPPSADIDAK